MKAPHIPPRTAAPERHAPQLSAQLRGTLPLMTALMMGGLSTVQAQEISTSLPLTSIGDQLMWSVGDQTLTLKVPLSGRVKLELYSPQLDPRDYRSDTYYGDETYDAAAREQAVATRFELMDAGGKVVATRSYAPGPQSWDTLFDTTLPAGSYQLRATTSGNAKNTFAVRLSGVSASLSADQLAVNVHSHSFVPVLNVTTDGPGYELQMYDGDGPLELEAQLRDAAGQVYPLAVSEQLGTIRLPLPEGAGHYTLELRQPQSAKQYSNTVGFSLRRAQQPQPLTLTSVDTLGLLRIEAELVLPGGNVPTTLPLTVGSAAVNAEPYEARTPAGTYPISVPPVQGAQVSAPADITVKKGETALARVQVRPTVALTLRADKAEVCVGDVVTFTAEVRTAYAGELPLDLALSSDAFGSQGLKLEGDAARSGSFNASQPGRLSVRATAVRAGDFSVSAKLSPWADMQALGVRVLPSAASFQLSRAEVASALPGEEVTVSLSIRNTADVAQPYHLRDTPGAALTALSSTEFSGTLEPGETKELSYRARVDGQGGERAELNASLSGSSVDGVPCGVPQTSQAVFTALTPAPVPVPEVKPTPEAPQVQRRSTVSLPFHAPASARTLVITHAFPPAASYLPGSSQLDGRALADPLVGASGRVYWTVPAQTSGTISYDLTHSEVLPALEAPALLARYDRERQEVLQGSVDSADLASARSLSAAPVDAAAQENPGPIKLPLAGTVYQARDRIGVAVESPLGSALTATVNGVPIPDSQIGTRVSDPANNLQRLEYVGVAIRQGLNVIALGQETLKVYLAGPTAAVSFTPLNLVADGSTPIRLKVRALDSAGQISGERFLSLSSNLEPLAPDASPGEAGYQIALKGGEGELVLQPQATPGELRLSYELGGRTQSERFAVVPDRSTVGVGVVSATLGLPGGLNLAQLDPGDVSWQARASFEGPLLGGKLYLAADKDGLPVSSSPYLRSPVSGDASIQSIPLQGIDPVAVNYDHPAFHAQYVQGPLPITVFSLNANLTALSAYSKTSPSVAGFLAFVPGDLKNELLTPGGTRLLRLSAQNIAPDSESLVVVVSKNGQELGRSPLTRYVDYTLDPATGVVTLTRGLEALDSDLNDLRVAASYRLSDPLAGRTLAYGAEARYQNGGLSVAAAAVQQDGKLTSGVRASYDSGTSGSGSLKASVLAAYSGGVQAAADVSGAFGGTVATATLHYQDGGYGGLNAGSAGLNASANLAARLTGNLSAVLSGEYHDLSTGSAATSTPDSSSGGGVAARADYRFAPFSLGGGVKYAFGDVYGVAAVASAGYHQSPIDVDVVHSQPLSGNLPATTDFTARVAIGKVNLGLHDLLTWGGDNLASLTLGTTLNNVNYAVNYELPTAGGAGNRARFGVDTSLPLSSNLRLGVRAAVVRDLRLSSGTASAGADLAYASDGLNATLGGDVAYDGSQLSTVLRGGVTGSLSRNLTLSADGTVDLTPGAFGARAGAGYAYRNSAWNSLGYLRYQSGSLSGGKPELSAGASVEYHTPDLALRGGLDTRTLLSDASSFTYQASLGGTYYPTDFLGVGAWGRTLVQPGSASSQYGYGLEGSLRALPGTWLSVGYNFAGFDGLGRDYTRQGLYLRLDLTLDETLGGRK